MGAVAMSTAQMHRQWDAEDRECLFSSAML